MLDNFIFFVNQSIFLSVNTWWEYVINLFSTTIIYFNCFYFDTFLIKNWIMTYLLNWFDLFLIINNFNLFFFNSSSNFFNQTHNWISILFFQNIEYQYLQNVFSELLVIQQIFTEKLINYNFTIMWIIFKYSIIFYFIFTIIIYTYYNTNYLNNLQNSTLSKLLHIIESEEELGSVDDSFTLIFLFMLVFGWFFFLSLSFAFLFNTQLTLFGLGALILIAFILLTPFSTLLDFGISFATYIRGASAGSNLLVECVFDIIGTLVVFTRFVVQNIRFVLIFFAYFELFEWTYNTTFVQYLMQIFNLNIEINPNQIWNLISLETSNLYYYFGVIIVTIISYLYYLVHLLILIFVQVTIYLLISFWLFFFFYTSFTMNKTEKIFIMKKLI